MMHKYFTCRQKLTATSFAHQNGKLMKDKTSGTILKMADLRHLEF